MRRQGLLARLAALVAVVVLTVSGAIVAAKVTASAGNPTEQTDTAWRSTNEATSPTGASRKPVLFQLLANNDKVDTYNDEIRLDAVVRVAHGEVDPTVGAGSSGGVESGATGLRFVYDYVNMRSASGGNDFSTNEPVKYLNTISGSTGAGKWASNMDQYYTIHKVVHSGLYDYVTLSFEADIDYVNQDQYPNWWNHTSQGRVMDTPPIYVMVGGYTNSSTYPMKDLSSLTSNPLATNLMAGRQTTVFPGMCNNYSRESCDVPLSFIGWDHNPNLWSNGQSNWGMVTDYGLNGQPAGTAPANSFFVRMYNGKYSEDTTNRCYQATSFKYQWVALKDNSNWVPVDDLTPTVQLVENQPASGAGAPPSDVNSAAFNRPGSQKTNTLFAPGPAQNPDGSIDFAKAKTDQDLDGYFKLVTWPVMNSSCSAIGTPDPYRNPTNPGITDSMSQSEVKAQLQNAWTVDTAFYKYDVKRPTTPTITAVSASDTASDGDIAVSNMADGDAQFSLGDSKSAGYSAATHPIIKGTGGKVGQQISVYEDVPKATGNFSDGTPKNIIAKGTFDDYDNTGHLVGTTVVTDPDGSWEIQASDANDVVDLSKPTERVRRYHAYQTDLSKGENGLAMNLASYFSPLAVVNFKALPDATPTFNTIVAKPDSTHTTSDVPHTVLNSDTNTAALPSGSKVKVSGTVTSNDGGSTLKIYAKPKGSTPSSGSQYGVNITSDSKVSCSASNATGSVSLGNVPQGTANWKCDIDPTWFSDQVASKGDQWTFTAVSVNSESAESLPATQTSEVNIYAPKPGMASADWKGITGTAVPDSADAKTGGVDEEGAVVSITWPDGTPSSAPTSLTIDNSSSGKAKGYWHFDLPEGTPKGWVKVKVTDKSTNQSVEESLYLVPEKPIASLPFTGGHSNWALIAALIIAALAAMSYPVFKKVRSGLVKKGAHAK